MADTVAPTAKLLGQPTIDPNTGDYLIVIQYHDDVALDATTFDSGDITLNQAFNGQVFPFNVTLLSTQVVDAQTTNVTYDFPPFFSGTFAITMGLGQVLDTSLNPVPAGNLGFLSIGFGDTTPPVAAIAQQPVLDPVSNTYTFTVTYNDDTAVDPNTIDSNDILVFGPGYAHKATKVSQFSNTDFGA